MRRRISGGIVAAHAVLILFAAVTAFPLVLILLMAFKTNQEILVNPLALPEKMCFDTIIRVWLDGNFQRYFVNSSLVAVVNVALVLILSGLATYALVHLRLPGANGMFVGFLLGYMIPSQAIIIPLFYSLSKYGLSNTRFGLALVEAAVWMPFAIFLLRSFFKNIPYELVENARIDGAPELRILYSIILPVATPALLTLIILQFKWSWNELLLALIILQKEALHTVTLGLLRLQGGRYTLNYTQIAAGVLLTSIPIVMVFLVFQRRFIQGLTAGAVKG